VTFTTPTSRPEPDELDAVVRRLEAERHALSRWWKTTDEDPRLAAARRAVLEAVMGEGEYGG
jgi:hypothetical protein